LVFCIQYPYRALKEIKPMRKAEEGLMHTVGFINFGVFLVSFFVVWLLCCEEYISR